MNWMPCSATLFLAFVLPAASLRSVSGGAAERSNPRVTPVVQAIQKTRASVVAVQVEKSAAAGARETVGTGVVIDERGYLLTSHHLVLNAARIRIRLADESEWNAKLFADDAATDLAVLQIRTPRSLRPLPLGTAADLLLGETVIAVGHPFGAGFTVSQGIVGALNQAITLPSAATLSGLIQTDASINPGNSGGPLLNINGEWIGVVVAVRDNARGIAYATNIDAVRAALVHLVSAARVAGVEHGILGLNEKREVAHGCRLSVGQVQGHGPAERAGMRPGDHILAVARNPVRHALDFERLLWDRRPGDAVTLRVRRADQELDLTIKLEAASPPPEAPVARRSHSSD